MISAFDKPNNVKEIYLVENQIKEDFPELLVQYMRHVRSQNTDYNHKLIKIDLSGNAISLSGSRDIDVQINMNLRYNAERKMMKNKQKISNGKVERLQYKNTKKKSKHLVVDLETVDNDYLKMQDFDEDLRNKYEELHKQDDQVL